MNSSRISHGWSMTPRSSPSGGTSRCRSAGFSSNWPAASGWYARIVPRSPPTVSRNCIRRTSALFMVTAPSCPAANMRLNVSRAGGCSLVGHGGRCSPSASMAICFARLCPLGSVISSRAPCQRFTCASWRFSMSPISFSHTFQLSL